MPHIRLRPGVVRCAPSKPAVGRRPLAEVPPIVRLWTLRLLVRLARSPGVLDPRSVVSDTLAVLIGDETLAHTRLEVSELDAVHRALHEAHAAAERDAADAVVPEPLAGNIARLAQIAGLDDTARRILEFAVMLHSEHLLDDAADHLSPMSTTKVSRALAVVLSLPEADVRAALDSRGKLAQSGLLTVGGLGAGQLGHKLRLLSERFVDSAVASSADPMSLLRESLLPSAPGHLGLADFAHLEASLAVLRPCLRRALAERRAGVNILLHGKAGTGKSQLSKAIAADLGCGLFEVSSEDADGDPIGGDGRLRAYRAAQCVLAQTRSLVLFDEVEDVFASGHGEGLFSFDATPARGRKAWINRALEANPVPALWLTNSVAAIDPAFIRRFEMVIELPVPPRRQREKIVREAGGALLDAGTVSRLADCETLAPAVIARAAAVVEFAASELGSVSPGEAVRRLVDQTLQAQGYRGIAPASALDLPEAYDPAFVQADADLTALARGLAHAGSGRLCLYGPPGTGKTAWARWLARELARPLVIRRASDMMSMWVGGNEKNIAAAFRRAEADGAVLVIDEVDSFLQDRRGADHAWEVSLVNEMLTQMESFEGIFIASTNLMEGLDSAALRRFDLKLRFGYLRSAQAWALLLRHAEVLGFAAPDAGLRTRLARLDRLTPGDFAAVARQHRFRPLGDAAAFVSALEGEVALKRRGSALPIGFV